MHISGFWFLMGSGDSAQHRDFFCVEDTQVCADNMISHSTGRDYVTGPYWWSVQNWSKYRFYFNEQMGRMEISFTDTLPTRNI